MTGCTAQPVASGVPDVPEETEQPSASSAPETSEETVYGGGFFDSSVVHTIDIQIAEEDWTDLLERSEEKIKYTADVTIDGELVKHISCSTKGNSSLLMVKKSIRHRSLQSETGFRPF